MEQYLSRQMSEEERLRFEAEIQADPDKMKDLRNRMQAELAVIATAREEEVASLRERFAQQAEAPVRSFSWVYLAAAAAVILIIGLIFLLRPQTELDPQAMFAANYEVPAAPQARGNNRVDSLLDEAHRLYNLEQYEQAIPLFEEYAETDPQKSTEQYQNTRLFMAIALLETNQLSKAIAGLNQLAQENEMAQWYLALAFLKQEQPQKAKTILESIATNDRHFYHERAISLLQYFP